MLNSPLGTGSTFWEGYLANGQFGYGGSYMSTAHGWATGPTSALTFYVLGIRPDNVVHPAPGDLKSAEGSLKTPPATSVSPGGMTKPLGRSPPRSTGR